MYLPDANSQSEVEYGEIKRPRLEMGAEPLMRHLPQRLPLPLTGAEDVVKVGDPQRQERAKVERIAIKLAS